LEKLTKIVLIVVDDVIEEICLDSPTLLAMTVNATLGCEAT
jgi:hypothetical protein